MRGNKAYTMKTDDDEMMSTENTLLHRQNRTDFIDFLDRHDTTTLLVLLFVTLLKQQLLQ